MEKQRNRNYDITRVALAILMVVATAWVVLHGRVTTAEPDSAESRCGGCRYATECVGKASDKEADFTVSCGAEPDQGGHHVD